MRHMLVERKKLQQLEGRCGPYVARISRKLCQQLSGTRVDELIVRMSRQIALMRQAHKGRQRRH